MGSNQWGPFYSTIQAVVTPASTSTFSLSLQDSVNSPDNTFYGDNYYMGSAPLAPPPIVFVTGTVLNSNQLLSLYGNPIQLVPAPGVGLMIQPIFGTLTYNPLTTDYVTGGITNFYIGPQIAPITTYVLQPVAISLVNGTYAPGPATAVAPPTNVVVSQISTFDNQPLVITHDGGQELVNGDGSVTVTLYYFIITS